MSERPSFKELIQRVRQGDEAAAEALLRDYEAPIRRVVRHGLRSQLRRACDSMDICQDVLASFFVRAASGQYDLETPQQLINLLCTMARNKLIKQVEREQAACRDVRLRAPTPVEQVEVAGEGTSPSANLAQQELLDKAHKLLSPEELRLVSLRRHGKNWPEIGRELNGNPEALRKQFERTMARITRQLGFDPE